MSFGFSVGDFVVLTEKAILIYNRCKDAPSEYADLTAHVQHLRDALEDTKTFLVEAERQGHIPQSQTRLASLKARHDGCSTTLDEVDEFLGRYKKVETEKGRRRIISLAKFIMSDAKTLAKKLEEDYRTGVREPTVVSRALVENEPIDRQELLEQISQDLEDSDIHPDSISLNMPFVDEWLSQAISNGTLEEGSTAPLVLLPITAGENKASSISDTQHSTSENGRSHASLSKGSASPLEAVKSVHKENVPSGDTDPYADIDQATTRPDDSITVLNGGIALQDARSRANSTASSASKPDDWHPYDRPAPAYVRDKLWPLLNDEPTPDPLSADSTHAIVRAFHQADYSDEGSLTRRTVLSHLLDVLKSAPGITHSEDLESIVLRFDANHDGYFDKNEFLCLVQDLMRRTSEARDSQIELEFANTIGQAKIHWADRRAADPFPFVQWGFRRHKDTRWYHDNVRHAVIDGIPRVTSLSAFSTMAWEANWCVSRISDFESEWIGIVPKTLQGEYRDPLRRVQRIATAFTLLENLSSRQMLSDLDAFLDCACIFSYLSNEADSQEVDAMSSQLEAAKRVCAGILDYVLGFTLTLEGAETMATSNYNNFGKFKSWWDLNRLTWRSSKTSDESAKWDLVKSAVSTFRATQILQDIQARALQLVDDFHKHEPEKLEKRKAELTAASWEGYIDDVSVTGLSRRWVGT
ncbi:unnamed protein product [Alternaria alternata]